MTVQSQDSGFDESIIIIITMKSSDLRSMLERRQGWWYHGFWVGLKKNNVITEMGNMKRGKCCGRIDERIRKSEVSIRGQVEMLARQVGKKLELDINLKRHQHTDGI